jgi:hypothetical protein
MLVLLVPQSTAGMVAVLVVQMVVAVLVINNS